MAAHLVAIGCREGFGAKHLGFPQLAAYLADAASFGKDRREHGRRSDRSRPSLAPRGGARWRSSGPSCPTPGSFIEQFFERTCPTPSSWVFFREQGWSEEAVSRQTQSVYRKASPREMAMVFEDGEVDPVWGLRMLQRHGFNDDDSGFLFKGILSRAAKSLAKNT